MIDAAENGKIYEKTLLEKIAADRHCNAARKAIEAGRANHTTAANYAERVGKLMAEALKPFGGELDGIDYDTAAATLRPLIYAGCEDVSKLTYAIQELLNKQAGISLKAMKATVNADRVNNLIYKLVGQGEEGSWMLGADVMGNITRSVVTDSIEANAEFHKEVGLRSYIERDGSNCCDWCAGMTGRYEYGQQPDDFFKVHKDCNCTILFQPSKRQWQRITYRTEESEGKKRIRKQTEALERYL